MEFEQNIFKFRAEQKGRKNVHF